MNPDDEAGIGELIPPDEPETKAKAKPAPKAKAPPVNYGSALLIAEAMRLSGQPAATLAQIADRAVSAAGLPFNASDYVIVAVPAGRGQDTHAAIIKAVKRVTA